jgi:hypothetical protein
MYIPNNLVLKKFYNADSKLDDSYKDPNKQVLLIGVQNNN